jgi:hypothetical protein
MTYSDSAANLARTGMLKAELPDAGDTMQDCADEGIAASLMAAQTRSAA